MYRVLLIGLGQIGLGYDYDLDENYILTHAKAFSLHEELDLFAVVDPNEKNRARFESKYKAKVFETTQKALSIIEPDVVVIAVPAQQHLNILQEVLEYSHPTLILCEKPLAYNFNDAHKIIDLCYQRGIKLIVNYMRQFQPSTIEIHRRLIAGEIQTPIRGIVFYTKGFLHNGSHFINLLSLWLGDMVGYQGITINKKLVNNDADMDITINFEKGKVSFISLEENNYSNYNMMLYAQNGCLRYDGGGNEIIWHQAKKSETIKGYTYLPNEGEELATDMNKSQWYVADEIYKMLKSSDHKGNASKRKLLLSNTITKEIFETLKSDHMEYIQ